MTHHLHRSSHALIVTAMLALVAGCEADETSDPKALVASSESVEGVTFEATVVRAYPESKWEFSSPFDMSIAPAQRTLHVVLEALLAAGELAEARQVHRWAEAELDRRANPLGGLRRGFLERVPEQRRLLELGAQLARLSASS